MNWKFWKAIPLPTRNISEPVTSFLKCFKDNHRRFSLKANELGWCYGVCIYTFTDKHTGESWAVSAHQDMFDSGDGFKLKLPNWLTDDEVTAVSIFMITHYTKRAERLKAIREERQTRHLRKERNRLINIYCK